MIERVDPLGVRKRYVEVVRAHELRREKLMELVGHETSDQDYRKGIPLMVLYPLFVAFVVPHDHKEEDAEEEVAKVLHHEREGCSVKYQGCDTISD